MMQKEINNDLPGVVATVVVTTLELEHVAPVHCGLHRQRKLLPVLKHEPPFKHGRLAQLPGTVKKTEV